MWKPLPILNCFTPTLSNFQIKIRILLQVEEGGEQYVCHSNIAFLILKVQIFKSSRLQMFLKIGVLKNY